MFDRDPEYAVINDIYVGSEAGRQLWLNLVDCLTVWKQLISSTCEVVCIMLSIKQCLMISLGHTETACGKGLSFYHS